MSTLSDATATRAAAEATLTECGRVFLRDFCDPNSPNNTTAEATAHSTHATRWASLQAAELAVSVARAAEVAAR